MFMFRSYNKLTNISFISLIYKYVLFTILTTFVMMSLESSCDSDDIDVIHRLYIYITYSINMIRFDWY